MYLGISRSTNSRLSICQWKLHEKKAMIVLAGAVSNISGADADFEAIVSDCGLTTEYRR